MGSTVAQSNKVCVDFSNFIWLSNMSNTWVIIYEIFNIRDSKNLT